MIFRLLRFSALVGLCLFSFSACTQEDSTSVQPAPQNKIKVTPKVVPQEVMVLDEAQSSSLEYVYDPSGLRDPFEALVMLRKPVFDDGQPLTPLQKYDLSQFRLSAVVVGKGEPTAMVVAPGGKAYVLKKGVKIGKNGGVVAGISPETIHVKEKYYDFTGKLSTTTVEIGFTQKAGDD